MAMFNVGDHVWAKMKGFPAWPSVILSASDAPAKLKPVPGRLPVLFYGTNETAYMKPHELVAYETGRAANEVPRKVKAFNAAVRLARHRLGIASDSEFDARFGGGGAAEHKPAATAADPGAATPTPKVKTEPVKKVMVSAKFKILPAKEADAAGTSEPADEPEHIASTPADGGAMAFASAAGSSSRGRQRKPKMFDADFVTTGRVSSGSPVSTPRAAATSKGKKKEKAKATPQAVVADIQGDLDELAACMQPAVVEGDANEGGDREQDSVSPLGLAIDESAVEQRRSAKKAAKEGKSSSRKRHTPKLKLKPLAGAKSADEESAATTEAPFTVTPVTPSEGGGAASAVDPNSIMEAAIEQATMYQTSNDADAPSATPARAPVAPAAPADDTPEGGDGGRGKRVRKKKSFGDEYILSPTAQDILQGAKLRTASSPQAASGQSGSKVTRTVSTTPPQMGIAPMFTTVKHSAMKFRPYKYKPPTPVADEHAGEPETDEPANEDDDQPMEKERHRDRDKERVKVKQEHRKEQPAKSLSSSAKRQSTASKADSAKAHRADVSADSQPASISTAEEEMFEEIGAIVRAVQGDQPAEAAAKSAALSDHKAGGKSSQEEVEKRRLAKRERERRMRAILKITRAKEQKRKAREAQKRERDAERAERQREEEARRQQQIARDGAAVHLKPKAEWRAAQRDDGDEDGEHAHAGGDGHAHGDGGHAEQWRDEEEEEDVSSHGSEMEIDTDEGREEEEAPTGKKGKSKSKKKKYGGLKLKMPKKSIERTKSTESVDRTPKSSSKSAKKRAEPVKSPIAYDLAVIEAALADKEVAPSLPAASPPAEYKPVASHSQRARPPRSPESRPAKMKTSSADAKTGKQVNRPTVPGAGVKRTQPHPQTQQQQHQQQPPQSSVGRGDVQPSRHIMQLSRRSPSPMLRRHVAYRPTLTEWKGRWWLHKRYRPKKEPSPNRPILAAGLLDCAAMLKVTGRSLAQLGQMMITRVGSANTLSTHAAITNNKADNAVRLALRPEGLTAGSCDLLLDAFMTSLGPLMSLLKALPNSGPMTHALSDHDLALLIDRSVSANAPIWGYG